MNNVFVIWYQFQVYFGYIYLYLGIIQYDVMMIGYGYFKIIIQCIIGNSCDNGYIRFF